MLERISAKPEQRRKRYLKIHRVFLISMVLNVVLTIVALCYIYANALLVFVAPGFGFLVRYHKRKPYAAHHALLYGYLEFVELQ